MTAKCGACGDLFRSEDGGAACQTCHRVFCPACEALHFTRAAQTEGVPVCIPCERAAAIRAGGRLQPA